MDFYKKIDTLAPAPDLARLILFFIYCLPRNRSSQIKNCYQDVFKDELGNGLTFISNFYDDNYFLAERLGEAWREANKFLRMK